MSELRAKASGAARKDRAAAAIARRQWGVASVWQLHEAGLDKDDILHRVRTGRLHRIHRGVYAVGHLAFSVQGRYMAAVLACGGPSGPEGTVLGHWGAAVSHRSAAGLWELLPPADGPVDVSIAGDTGRKARRGIRIHRSLTLLPAAVTLRCGIAVTRPARTIWDLERTVAADGRQGLVSARELRRAIRQADVLGLPLGLDWVSDRSRSDLERDFLRFCLRHGLPAPEVNVRVGSHLVDFLWREPRLIVETDGYRYHRGRAAFEDDRARDLELKALGYETIRLSQRQVLDEPDRVATVLAETLSTAD